jgi:hypothetical protein
MRTITPVKNSTTPASKQNVFAVGPIPVLAHASAFNIHPTIIAMIEQKSFSFLVKIYSFFVSQVIGLNC